MPEYHSNESDAFSAREGTASNSVHGTHGFETRLEASKTTILNYLAAVWRSYMVTDVLSVPE